MENFSSDLDAKNVFFGNAKVSFFFKISKFSAQFFYLSIKDEHTTKKNGRYGKFMKKLSFKVNLKILLKMSRKMECFLKKNSKLLRKKSIKLAFFLFSLAFLKLLHSLHKKENQGQEK